MELKHIDTLVFDLNGTLYEAGKPIEGVTDLITKLRDKGYHLHFITNTDGRRVSDVHNRLLKMGIKIEFEELLTPVSAFLQMAKSYPEATYHFLVSDDVLKDMHSLTKNDVQPDFVVIGDFSDKLDYATLNQAFRLIKNGAQIISLSNTLWYIGKDGEYMNTGAFVRMFEETCGKKARLMGKPSLEFFEMALKKTTSNPKNTLVIGDDLLTDIYGGKTLGATTVQVQTGVYNKMGTEAVTYEPDYIIKNVNGLLDLLDL